MFKAHEVKGADCHKAEHSKCQGSSCAITGASEGLGAVVALHLAKAGVALRQVCVSLGET